MIEVHEQERQQLGRGGGPGGRAIAFCSSRPDLNSEMAFGFFRLIVAVFLFSLGFGLNDM